MQDVEKDAQSLCMACGLCCDGTLFNQAKLEPDDDLTELSALGARIHGDRKFFDLPCQAHKGICTIYNHRPRICGDFGCRLLISHSFGEISYEDATKIIDDIKHKSHALRVRMEAVVGKDELCLQQLYVKVSDLRDDANRNLLFDYAILLHLIRKHFLKDEMPMG